MSGRFERFKCSFGTDMSWTIPPLKLDVPGLTGLNFPEAEVYNGQIAISRFLCLFLPPLPLGCCETSLSTDCYSDEIKQFFDVKIEEMYALIEDQLGRVQKKHPGENIVCTPYSKVWLVFI